MKTDRPVLAVWAALIVVLVVVELAELTHRFTFPVQSALADPIAVLFALVFTTVLALVGAVFIGIYFSHRLRSPGSFTPFEEEMLRMRSEVALLKEKVESIHSVVTDPRTPVDAKGAGK
jgi:hypothetical protein